MALAVKSKNAVFDESALKNLSDLVKKASGIDIKPEKAFLFETRLKRHLEKLQVSDIQEYVNSLAQDTEELQACVELLTTHKTEWFREVVHYQWLKKELPHLALPNQALRIWSAACSSGPEIYSLLFLLLKEGFHHGQFRLLGTDISRAILDKAIELPESAEFEKQKQFLLRHADDKFKIESEINLALKNSIRFREFNLIDGEIHLSNKFDVIFLRNVLIYFDHATVISVCRNLCRHLRPEGYLILGLSESLNGELPELVTKGNSVYQYLPRRAK